MAYHIPGTPSNVYKIEFGTLSTYGEIDLLSRGGTQEEVHSMGLDVSTRHLYALTNIDGSLIVVTLLLYAVIRVRMRPQCSPWEQGVGFCLGGGAVPQAYEICRRSENKRL